MKRTLMVASAGGHLTQLDLILPRLRPFIRHPLWVTYDVPQARSLLSEAEIIQGHHPTTRNLLNALRNYKLAVDIFDEHDISRVISTGAGLAVPFMIRARRLGIACHYIETATRVTSPSLTGRILEKVPGVTLYTQYPHWVRPGWLHVGSVYDGFSVEYGSAEPVRRIFVTLGTQDYPFGMLVDAVEELLRDDEVVWQLGATDAGRGLPGTVHTSLPTDEQDRLLRESDVVVGHCGTGLALSSLQQGRTPVLVPRRQRRGEHVDDHQVITAKELRERDLAVVREVELLDRHDLERAAGAEARRSTAQPFRLVEGEQVPDGAEPLTTPAQWRRRLGLRLALADAVTIGTSSLLAYIARNTLGQAGVVGEFANEIPVALAVMPLWLLLFYWFGAYRPEYLNSSGDAFRRFTAGVTGGVLALGFVSFVFQLRLSRLYVLFLFLLVFTLGGLARLGLRHRLGRRYERGELTQNVLIVGADDEAAEVARAMRGSTRSGYEVVGFVDDELDEGSSVDGVPVVGAVRDVLEKAYQLRAGLVVVSPGGVESGTLQDILVELEGTPIDLAVAPSLFEVVTRRVTIESIANVPILHVDQIRLERGKAFVKRSLDLVVATLLGLLTLAVTAFAAVAVRIGSPGPILFRQQRLGRDGRPFTIYKFRTMVEDAEERLQEVEHLNEVGHGFFKVREDPRVTRVGRTLRKWSIDELPQLWNVLRGDMSMVGPRPPLPEEVEDYESWQLRRLRVRPGITGIWQVSGRSHVPFEEAVRMDLFYIENWSLGFDLYLLAKTVPAVLGRSGAY